MINKKREYGIKYGNRQINFTVIFDDKKSLSMSVNPDQTVVVKAPAKKSIDEINYRVKKRAPWIVKQLDYFERFQPLPPGRKYISGETHLYLGRQYRLKVVRGNPETVKLKGRFLWVYTSNMNNNKRIKEQVQKWYRVHAIELISKKLEDLIHKARKAKIPEPDVKFRFMKKRWGSCTKSNTILLNIELVKAPIHCIDYVIAHELCHLKHKNHGPAYWRLLSRLMPDWKVRKLKLEGILI